MPQFVRGNVPPAQAARSAALYSTSNLLAAADPRKTYSTHSADRPAMDRAERGRSGSRTMRRRAVAAGRGRSGRGPAQRRGVRTGHLQSPGNRRSERVAPPSPAVPFRARGPSRGRRGAGAQGRRGRRHAALEGSPGVMRRTVSGQCSPCLVMPTQARRTCPAATLRLPEPYGLPPPSLRWRPACPSLQPGSLCVRLGSHLSIA